ncbi:MAG: TRAP transporter small permease subunit [Synergistetes bacterium]|nr:TRAP transporter small permease subunit [Synergistota bacterium]MDW8193152.1 TRAP transporter small permease subunit [Synergistota bacterium]
MERFLSSVDKISEAAFKVTMWLIIPLFGSLFYEVIARYGFKAPTIWSYDLTYMLYGIMFILCSPYVLSRNKHVRIDLFYEKFSPKTKNLIDAILYVVFFFPAISVLLIKGTEYAIFSWKMGETSSVSPWRPPLYPLKTIFAIAVFLLLLQGIVQFIRIVRELKKGGGANG